MESTSPQLDTTAPPAVSSTDNASETPSTGPPRQTSSRIVYTREQLLSLNSTGQGCHHPIPEELIPKTKRKHRGCRAGVRHREKKIQRAVDAIQNAMDEIRNSGPFIGIHRIPGNPLCVTVEQEWPENVPIFAWNDSGELERMHSTPYCDHRSWGLDYSEYYTLNELLDKRHYVVDETIFEEVYNQLQKFYRREREIEMELKNLSFGKGEN